MKSSSITIILFILISCNHAENKNADLQKQVDSLQARLANTYRPGFGEFMSEIQVHHEKLWFAGDNQNWLLADFEINEIKESLADIREYCTDRPESKDLQMIDAPIDSINTAIQQKNNELFKKDFVLLTVTCNSCHQATNHGFNVIKQPDTPPFSNQVFKLEKAQ
jgi:hypothetical protein